MTEPTQMEECDVQLLLLGKLCKGSLDLPRWVTSRADRDFRIDLDKIAECQDVAREKREKRKRPAGGRGKGKSKGGKKKKGSATSSKTKSTRAREASVFIPLGCGTAAVAPLNT